MEFKRRICLGRGHMEPEMPKKSQKTNPTPERLWVQTEQGLLCCQNYKTCTKYWMGELDSTSQGKFSKRRKTPSPQAWTLEAQLLSCFCNCGENNAIGVQTIGGKKEKERNSHDKCTGVKSSASIKMNWSSLFFLIFFSLLSFFFSYFYQRGHLRFIYKSKTENRLFFFCSLYT